MWGRCTRRVRRSVDASTSGTSANTSTEEKEINAYEVLGVDVTASHRAVRDAFRFKAKDAHPDRGGSSEAFDLLKRAQEVLTDDDARAALDAKLLDVPIGSVSLEELKWSRELSRLAEEEEAGEARGADAVLASARACAVAEKALAQLAMKKKKDAEKLSEEKKTRALETANATRRKNAKMASKNDGRGEDEEVTVIVTPEMLETLFSEKEDGQDVGIVSLDVTTEMNCKKCNGWGEKEGHWTMALDKLCPTCKGCGRVEVSKKVKIPVRVGVTDGETFTVYKSGNAGYRRVVTVLGQMGDEGTPGDLLVTVRVLKEGQVG